MSSVTNPSGSSGSGGTEAAWLSSARGCLQILQGASVLLGQQGTDVKGLLRGMDAHGRAEAATWLAALASSVGELLPLVQGLDRQGVRTLGHMAFHRRSAAATTTD
jgi:hypothetical protein